MKKTFNILPLAVIVLAASCEDAPDNWSGTDRLNFTTTLNYYGDPVLTDTLKSFTFAYEAADAQQATVWIDVETQGRTSDHPRALKIAVDNSYGITDAVAGKHFVDFENAELSDKYVIPAGVSKAKIPIVVLRDPELRNKSVSLRITFAENEYFTLGFDDYRRHRTIVITDRLAKPDLWDRLSSYFGTYGEVKHQFMIDATGEIVDDNYLQTILDTEDRSYYGYLRDWFQMKLDEENARLEAENKDPLTEENETVVTFKE